jgi:DNA-binding winged helix-turn-helix (wHTH) protein
MPLPGTGGEIYRFGPFELAQASGELRKHGLRLKLQDQPVRLLILLLENAGEVVTREQIQERLWVGDVHVDYENAINSAVRKLREVLIDTSENPRFVETLARRGYRFIAPVSRVSTTSVPAEPAVAPVEVPVPAARQRNLYWIWPVVALVAVAAFWFWPGRNGVGPPQQPVPLTSYPGYESWPSFSPDGNQVAFAWNAEKSDKYDIYVQLIGSGRPLRLTTDLASNALPVWSPDGRSIAFRRFDTSWPG